MTLKISAQHMLPGFNSTNSLQSEPRSLTYPHSIGIVQTAQFLNKPPLLVKG